MQGYIHHLSKYNSSDINHIDYKFEIKTFPNAFQNFEGHVSHKAKKFSSHITLQVQPYTIYPSARHV
jgi:hypothetical protein